MRHRRNITQALAISRGLFCLTLLTAFIVHRGRVVAARRRYTAEALAEAAHFRAIQGLFTVTSTAAVPAEVAERAATVIPLPTNRRRLP
jgi:hypothetical protein